MAKVAIIGSSFSKCLYSAKDEPNMSGWTTEKRIEWAETEWPLAHVLEDYDNYWVNLLAKKYPQHEFHVFAEGGAGWEFSEMVLHKVAELKFDRVIVELQEPRLMIYTKKLPSVELLLDTDYLESIRILSEDTLVINYPHICSTFDRQGLTVGEISQICFYASGGKYDDTRVAKLIKYTLNNWKLRDDHFNDKSLFVYTDEVINYMATNITGPIYATRYKQYLLSLKNVWPKVFDKVGVWAYLPINMPWSDLDLYAEIFGDELKIFEDVAIEEWIRKDPINNSIDTWRNIYYGADRQHANSEGMKLIADFLLKQPSIQKVFE